MSYEDSEISEIKSQVNIIKVIGKYVDLGRKGRQWWGCCPFHPDKTPSLTVSEEKQVYHCFGCQEGGDVITFLRQFFHLTFREAVEKLEEF